jgi:hypothetical protein
MVRASETNQEPSNVPATVNPAPARESAAVESCEAERKADAAEHAEDAEALAKWKAANPKKIAAIIRATMAMAKAPIEVEHVAEAAVMSLIDSSSTAEELEGASVKDVAESIFDCITFEPRRAADLAKRLQKELKNPAAALDRARVAAQREEMGDDKDEAKAEARQNGEAWGDISEEWTETWLEDNWTPEAEAEFIVSFENDWLKDHGTPFPATEPEPEVEIELPEGAVSSPVRAAKILSESSLAEEIGSAMKAHDTADATAVTPALALVDTGFGDLGGTPPQVQRAAATREITIIKRKFTAADIEKDCPVRLREISSEIGELYGEARQQAKRLDDHVIAINKLISEAQDLCDVGGYDKFRELFCPQLGKSQAYVRLAIAAGKTTLVEHRAKERERKQKTRAKAVVANSGTVPEKADPETEAPGAGIGSGEPTRATNRPNQSGGPAAVANSGTVPENSDTEPEAPGGGVRDGEPARTTISPNQLVGPATFQSSLKSSDSGLSGFNSYFVELKRRISKHPVERFQETAIPPDDIKRVGYFLIDLARALKEKAEAAKLAATTALPDGGVRSAAAVGAEEAEKTGADLVT